MWTNRRTLFVALGGSLLLNLLLVGFVAGRYVATRDGRFWRGGGQAIIPVARIRDLPPADGARYRATIADHRAAVVAARQAVRDARERARAAIAAPVLDRATLVDDLAKLRAAFGAQQAAIHDALVDAVDNLSPAARQGLVNGLHKPEGADR